MPLFRYSITLKSSFNEILDLHKIELCTIKLKKKKIAWNSSSIKNATIGLLEYGVIILIKIFLHGTQFPETRVPCNFFFFKFDRA